MDQQHPPSQWEHLPPELKKLHTLYPDMNYDQLLEAWQNVDNYIRVVLRIHQRLRGKLLDDSEAESYDRPKVDSRY